MSIYEYDAEKHMAMERTEAYERGIKLAKSVIKLHKEGKTDEEIVKGMQYNFRKSKDDLGIVVRYVKEERGISLGNWCNALFYIKLKNRKVHESQNLKKKF